MNHRRDGIEQEDPNQTRPTFAMSDLVIVEVRGIKLKHPSRVMCPDDCGLVVKFGEWRMQHDIHPARLLTSGGGVYLALFEAEHIPAIRTFLAEHADEVTP